MSTIPFFWVYCSGDEGCKYCNNGYITKIGNLHEIFQLFVKNGEKCDYCEQTDEHIHNIDPTWRKND